MLGVLENAEDRERVRERFNRHLVRIWDGQLEQFVGHACNVACAHVGRLAFCRARDVERGDAARRARARLLERVARLVWIADQLCDEHDIVDILNSDDSVAETRRVVLDEEGESARAKQRFLCFEPSSGKLGWVARIFDDVASFCFDGNDA